MLRDCCQPADGLTKDAQLDLDGFQNVLKLRAEIEAALTLSGRQPMTHSGSVSHSMTGSCGA
jgi:hypothetical protein